MSQIELIDNKENQKNQLPNQNSFLKIDELKLNTPKKECFFRSSFLLITKLFLPALCNQSGVIEIILVHTSYLHHSRGSKIPRKIQGLSRPNI